MLFFNNLAHSRIPCKSLKFQSRLFSSPTALGRKMLSLSSLQFSGGARGSMRRAPDSMAPASREVDRKTTTRQPRNAEGALRGAIYRHAPCHLRSTTWHRGPFPVSPVKSALLNFDPARPWQSPIEELRFRF
jgi:hypothetical protein